MLWEELCRRKQTQLVDRIPKEWVLPSVPPDVLNVTDVPRTCGILNELELDITEEDEVDVLLDKLRRGQWTCVQVTTAYLKRALIAHQLVNCLTEFWIDDALARAKELDEALASSGPVGPLHGLPISLKDQFHVKGKELNMGFASWIGQISGEDAALVKVLRKAGAVIYTRTNVPQTLMKPETDNHVYGTTVNPVNRNLTCGGSSGGEGALLALKGSPLGVGTDIGGSVRIPATFNSLYGLKPVCRRVPYAGAANTMVGGEGMESSIGPLARTLNGCATFLRAVAWGRPWDVDPNVNLTLWDENAYTAPSPGKMTFAYFVDNGDVRALPPVRRAMDTTIQALKAEGHQVIPWDVSLYPEMIKLCTLLYASGGSADFDKIMEQSGEPRRVGVRMLPDPGYTVYDYWQLVKRRNELRASHLKQWMSSIALTETGRPIDGLICPAAPWSAPLLGTNRYGGYTTVFNLLDVPSVTLPVTNADSSLDQKELAYEPKGDSDAYHQTEYDPEKFHGGPVGVQVVGRRNREEELLNVASVIDKAIKTYHR